jgi:hypothetical protein
MIDILWVCVYENHKTHKILRGIKQEYFIVSWSQLQYLGVNYSILESINEL